MSTAIEVIDSDLGRTGSTTEGRQGFKDLVARVTLGQVGIIFAYDVTRLARNCTELVSTARLVRVSALPRRRPGRRLRPGHDQRPLDPGAERVDLGTGVAYHSCPLDRWDSQQGSTRRTGLAVTGRAGARPPGTRAQASRPRGPGAHRPGLRNFPASGVRLSSRAPFQRRKAAHPA